MSPPDKFIIKRTGNGHRDDSAAAGNHGNGWLQVARMADTDVLIQERNDEQEAQLSQDGWVVPGREEES